MFNGLTPLAPKSSFGLGSVLTGISKTLNIANKAIPIYKQVKPMISNIGPVFKMVKGLTSSPKKTSTSSIRKISTKNPIKNNTIKQNSSFNNTNNPVFFLNVKQK